MLINKENNEKGNNPIKIFPNPASSEFVISLNSSENQFQSVSIYNLVGNKVLSMNLDSIKTTINLSGYYPGTYFVKVLDRNNQSFVNKIIVY